MTVTRAGWYIVDGGGEGEIVGGPFQSTLAAERSRQRLERAAPDDSPLNLWVSFRKPDPVSDPPARVVKVGGRRGKRMGGCTK